jgi:RNA-directed DNA polymerase
VDTVKPFTISKHLVMDAFKAVKTNAGSAGVDHQSIADFEVNLQDNLYKIWNRMSSGTYFPPPVKAVAIPKKSGGERILGVPTVSDRIAQMVVKLTFEPAVEAIFLPDSYGYRPGKSALDAVGVTRERCWKYNWVFEFDIKGLFDNIDHELLMRAVKHHTDCKWVILYIERWLKAPMQKPDGTLVERSKGTPQGGVVSPVLSNLFLHYAFDVWMGKVFPKNPWCRYADDGLVHCKSEKEALTIKASLSKRLAECGLELHPNKTKIVYCKDDNRRNKYPTTKFDFLGYTFRTREAENSKTKKRFVSFSPAVSPASLKSMRQKIRDLGIRRRSDLNLLEISRLCEPILRGWEQYYGKYNKSSLDPIYQHFNRTLKTWAMGKYKKLRGRKIAAGDFIEGIAKKRPQLFNHWSRGLVGFA